MGEALAKLIKVNNVSDGRARIILLARSGRDFWKTKTPGTKKTDLLIMTGEAQHLPPASASRFHLTGSTPFRRSRALKVLTIWNRCCRGRATVARV